MNNKKTNKGIIIKNMDKTVNPRNDFFKYVNGKFIDHYSNSIKIEKSYFEYEPIYQLYFCLLNVHLWSRKYIKKTKNLLDVIFKKIKF